ncbi:hypothetical protein FB45DRAFT_739895 [Roridomyces roridus]|uniref:G-patch domain-containing protein n=1 Tax=Roridomyces roridus TaxID=1738132 RepID=A0AAD7FTQ1_9AGAR|nr:hypothetical protein FB45DRAFT_739895 [Roridomyces roridus]
MSDDEDDYLSNLDKFLVEPAKKTPITYSEQRKEAAKQSKLKDEKNRLKGRRQRELESRSEGLSKSLFERAKEDEDAGLASGNKALSIMLKMGFKPGQALGKAEDGDQVPPPPPDTRETETPRDTSSSEAGPSRLQHKVEPVAINEWTGKRGIGLGVKRARSPTAAERVAKMAKMADDASHRDFRDRAKMLYDENRAEGRLAPAQRTCAILDEKAGKAFNVLWLNPRNPDTFPAGLTEALNLHTTLEINPTSTYERDPSSIQARLRRQMAADTLQPLNTLDDASTSTAVTTTFSSEALEETAHFLRLHAPDRLELVLAYLRQNYAYCFWCGTEYESQEEMASQCPGEDEEAHD